MNFRVISIKLANIDDRETYFFADIELDFLHKADSCDIYTGYSRNYNDHFDHRFDFFVRRLEGFCLSGLGDIKARAVLKSVRVHKTRGATILLSGYKFKLYSAGFLEPIK